jgi:DHA1 family multidrug/chloramphenicol efflux transport protein-like MFS transporter
MLIQSVGIECSNIIYATHNNLSFGLYCAVSGLLYAAVVAILFKVGSRQEKADAK